MRKHYHKPHQVALYAKVVGHRKQNCVFISVPSVRVSSRFWPDEWIIARSSNTKLDHTKINTYVATPTLSLLFKRRWPCTVCSTCFLPHPESQEKLLHRAAEVPSRCLRWRHRCWHRSCMTCRQSTRNRSCIVADSPAQIFFFYFILF